MAETYKSLGQNAPNATTLTDIYTVPAAKQAVIGRVVICNEDTSSCTVRVAVCPAGAAINAKHYLLYDYLIGAKDSIAPEACRGITMDTTDVLRVYSSNNNLTAFNVMGSEIQ